MSWFDDFWAMLTAPAEHLSQDIQEISQRPASTPTTPTPAATLPQKPAGLAWWEYIPIVGFLGDTVQLLLTGNPHGLTDPAGAAATNQEINNLLGIPNPPTEDTPTPTSTSVDTGTPQPETQTPVGTQTVEALPTAGLPFSGTPPNADAIATAQAELNAAAREQYLSQTASQITAFKEQAAREQGEFSRQAGEQILQQKVQEATTEGGLVAATSSRGLKLEGSPLYQLMAQKKASQELLDTMKRTLTGTEAGMRFQSETSISQMQSERESTAFQMQGSSDVAWSQYLLNKDLRVYQEAQQSQEKWLSAFSNIVGIATDILTASPLPSIALNTTISGGSGSAFTNPLGNTLYDQFGVTPSYGPYGFMGG